MKNNVLFNPDGSFIRSILALIIGGLAVFVPDLTLKSIVIYLGILILLSSIIFFVFALRNDVRIYRNYLMMQSLFNLIIGILFLIIPEVIVNIFVIIIGIIFLFIGILQLITAFYISRYFNLFWFSLITSVLTIIAGILLFTNPFESAEAILIFTGILLMIYGIGEFLMAWQLNKRSKIY